MATIAAFIMTQVSVLSAFFFMWPCLLLSPDWYTLGHSPMNETRLLVFLNRPMSSTEAATSRAPNASNPGRLMMVRAYSLWYAVLAIMRSSRDISPLMCMTARTYWAMSTMSPGPSFRASRYDWCFSPDVELPTFTS